MNIAITGVTGLIGRNLLFEITKQNLSNLNNLKIFILGRSSADLSLEERMKGMFLEEGFDYIDHKEKEDEIKSFIDANLIYVEISLSSKEFFLNPDQAKILKDTPIDYFFHLAASPDLRTSEKVAQQVMKINYEGTLNLLNAIQGFDIKEFDYVGTAFVSGKTTGNIAPDYLNPNEAFNNPYEKSKLLSEKAVREFTKERGMKCRFFRPGIVCGRLIEKPLGHINKFDVFYQIFSFFYLEKLKKLKNVEKMETEEVDVNMRIVYTPESGANIVAVDYLVKVLYQACVRNIEGESFHLVNEKNIVFQDFLESSQVAMKFTGVQKVAEKPKDMNLAERVYYSLGDELFTAYLASEPKFFDTSNLQSLLKEINLECPAIDHENIIILMKYAMSKNFGFNIPQLMKKMR